jgi:hypothetical protein
MSHINEKNFHLSGKKSLEFFEKASIPLKMSSKNLVIFKKASEFLSKPPISLKRV